MKVFVYFNLHKKVFSIKALEGPCKGRVIAHRRELMLYDAVFKVSEAGRQRVLREKRKNVHAGVVGHWFGAYEPEVANQADIAVTYNPYKYSTFVYADGEFPIVTAESAYLVNKKIFI